MTPSQADKSPHLSLSPWLDLLEQFEEAWQGGPPPDVADFLRSRLPPDLDPALSRQLLEELVKIDLEYQWSPADRRTGGPAGPPGAAPTLLRSGRLLDHYLRTCPQLGPVEQLSGELIAEEYRVRQRWGDRPAAAAYLARFPHQAAVLADLLARVDQELLAEGVGGPRKTAVMVSSPAALTGVAGVAGAVPQVPRYEDLAELARGGMGVVYRAFDPELSRPVAIKVLADACRDAPAYRQRFLEEARITAQLQHPGIPPVHEIGSLPDGSPFLVMKLIKGQTLDHLLRERPDPGHERGRFLAVFEQVCQAVGYAHSRGILHRDLKPANVMVGAFGEVQVMDWGLAKVLAPGRREPAPGAGATDRTDVRDPRLGSDGSQTRIGMMLGTPAYVAPEQAAGAGDAVDARADVFGLGAILCVILTGRPPYVGDSVESLRRLALRGKLDETYARLEGCGAEPDLVALARHCLAARPEDRPADGGVVAAEVTRLLLEAEERVRRADLERVEAQAERAKALTRAVEERKRRKVQLALAASLLMLVLMAGAGVWWEHWQAAQHERQLQAQRLAAETALVQARELQKRGWWKQAEELLEQAEQQVGPEGGASLSGRLAAARDGLRLLVRLDRIRQGKVALVQLAAGEGTVRNLDPARVSPRYEVVFREFGLDLLAQEVAEAARLLQESPVREELIAAVDDWALDEPDPRRRERLDQVAATATGEEWRHELSRLRKDPQALARRAEELKKSGGSPGLVVRLARALEANHLDSLPLLEACSRLRPDDFWLCFERAARYWARKQYDAAAGACQAALALQPESLVVWNNLGVILQDKGDLEGSISCYRTALRLDPDNAVLLSNLGDALNARNDPREAADVLRAAIRIEPTFPQAHLNLGNALVLQGDIAGAVECYRTALRLDPKGARAHVNLGLALSAKGETDAAIACFRAALQIDSKDVQAHVNLGFALKARNDPEGAITSFRTALGLAPNFVNAHLGLGFVLLARNDLEGAIASFRAALRLDPKLAPVHNGLGCALHLRGNLEEARECFRSAIGLDPKLAEAHQNLGLVLAELNDPEGAILCYRTALKLDPKLARAHNGQGALLLDRRELEEARTCFRTAIGLDPKLVEAHTNLGIVLRELGDLEGAIASLRTAIGLDPKQALAHFTLGVVLIDRKDLEGAIASFRKANELAPDHPLFLSNLRHAEHWRELAARLPAILAGREPVRGAREQLALAQFCRQFQKRYRAAAGFYRDAFAADPKLARDMQERHRYQAACCAALAAAGKGEDARNLPREKALDLVWQARHWLWEDLTVYCTQAAQQGSPQLRRALAQLLAEWQQDPDLAGVRDPDRLAALPEAERRDWTKLWREVAELRKQLAETK